MKSYRQIIIWAVLVSLTVLLSGCHSPEPESTADSTVSNTTTDHVPSVSDTGNSEETTSDTDPYIYEKWVRPEQIYIPSLTSNDLASAEAAVRDYLAQLAAEDGVLSFEVEQVTYDPISTDSRNRDHIRVLTDSEITSPEEYYNCHVTFAVTCSASYDHEKVPHSDLEHQTGTFTVYRESADAPWQIEKQDSAWYIVMAPKALDTEEASALELVTEPVLAAYLTEDGTYIIYTQGSPFHYYEFDSNGNCVDNLQLSEQWIPYLKE